MSQRSLAVTLEGQVALFLAVLDAIAVRGADLFSQRVEVHSDGAVTLRQYSFDGANG